MDTRRIWRFPASATGGFRRHTRQCVEESGRAQRSCESVHLYPDILLKGSSKKALANCTNYADPASLGKPRVGQTHPSPSFQFRNRKAKGWVLKKLAKGDDIH
jgi:hypothetical protein